MRAVDVDSDKFFFMDRWKVNLLGGKLRYNGIRKRWTEELEVGGLF